MSVVKEARRLVQRTSLTVYEATIQAAQVSLWLAQGNHAAAEAWAEQSLFDPDALEYVREEEYLALARVYLEQRQCASVQSVQTGNISNFSSSTTPQSL